MKTCKNSLTAILVLSAFLLSGQLAMGQKPDSAQAVYIKKLVDNQQYIFYGESATPMKGRQRFLTPGNTVHISKDTVASDLPYFGRAYSASIDPTNGGIKFTSTSFDYKAETRKKGGWDVTIKTKDVKDTQTLSFTIFEDGKAYLQVTSNNRQSISFNGYVK